VTLRCKTQQEKNINTTIFSGHNIPGCQHEIKHNNKYSLTQLFKRNQIENIYLMKLSCVSGVFDQ